MRPLLDPALRVVVPDLRGFDDSDRFLVDPDTYYSPAAQARSVPALITDLPELWYRYFHRSAGQRAAH